ncbi:MAG: hypothetical protein PHU49_02300 [Syntrophorhabdaceae bacterium]|nr:hypothetical protein [Syntrophorhabdaceae bacterium]MDD5242825.1 hypothetical protein [Syntrophorhabdaceae bacterium]
MKTKAAVFLVSLVLSFFWGIGHSFAEEVDAHAPSVQPYFVDSQSSKSNGTWAQAFRGQLSRVKAMIADDKPVSKRDLYELGRAYIRKKQEDQLLAITATGSATSSEQIVLLNLYEFFEYCNPLGLPLGDDVPGFDSNVPYNETLHKRWDGMRQQSVRTAVRMYDYGDRIYGPQAYETGRTIFLSKLHSLTPPPDDLDLTALEWTVMRSSLLLINYLNSPGGPNLKYAPVFPIKKFGTKPKETRWAKVHKILVKNAGRIGIGDGFIDFILGSPSSWQIVSTRLPMNKDLEKASIDFATNVNKGITKAAALFTDLSNAEIEGDRSALFANHFTGDDYANFLPPSIRVNFLRYVRTPMEPTPDMLAKSMLGFEHHGRTYGLGGWQGIARKYLSTRKRNPTLSDFEKYLKSEFVLLEDAALGKEAEKRLDSFLDKPDGEASLGVFFSKISIFSLM